MWLELFLLALLTYLWYQWVTPKRPSGFPPGPTNFPLVGGALSLLRLGKTGAEQLSAFGDKYGPISALYFGNKASVIVNDFEMAKEMSCSEDFINRPRIFQVDYVFGGKALGVFFANGELWKEQRRFSLRTLREFGFGKSSLEGIIHEEVEETINSFKKAIAKDGVTSVHDKFGVSVINILWAVIAGKRFSHDDERLKHIMRIIFEGIRSGSASGSFFNTYPWLIYIPIVNRSFKKFLKSFQVMEGFLNESVVEHKMTRDANFSRDFFDVYLKEMEEEEERGNTNSTFFEKQLVALTTDLFQAGAESTSNTVAFAILYVLLNPKVQAKIHSELDSVVGKNRLPSLEDKPKLHYLEAVMTECYRMNPIAPVSVPKTCQKDMEFHGFTIPKDSIILITIRAIHYDKSYWKDPETFRPERFLDSEGHFVKPERVIAFGMGKRACLGEPLARMSAFLLFAAMMQHFTFELVENTERPSTEPVDGFTVAPKPFNAKITPRF